MDVTVYAVPFIISKCADVCNSVSAQAGLAIPDAVNETRHLAVEYEYKTDTDDVTVSHVTARQSPIANNRRGRAQETNI